MMFKKVKNLSNKKILHILISTIQNMLIFITISFY
jgi:hypothetical protein